MPIHDWTRVDAGIFHQLHLGWIPRISDALNGGLLPDSLYALGEARVGGAEPDVLTLQRRDENDESMPRGVTSGGWTPGADDGGGLAVATAPPKLEIEEVASEAALYASKQRRVVIRHASDDRIVSLIEIVSPGNKDSRAATAQFVTKAVSALQSGYHLTLIDLFPPGPRGRRAMHERIWREIGPEPYVAPAGRPLTLSAYRVDGPVTAYVEPTAVGRELIDLPLFFSPERYVNVPLAETYAAAYAGVPARWRRVVEGAAT